MLEDTAGLAQALIETGMVLVRKGETARAREPFAASAPAVERWRRRGPQDARRRRGYTTMRASFLYFLHA
jgi:hypothetical protein